MLTLMKNYIDEKKTQKKINVKKTLEKLQLIYSISFYLILNYLGA